MKVRNGFVSNSSSSSFVIKKESLTPVQESLLKGTAGQTGWTFSERGGGLLFYTYMDNFDLVDYAKEIGIKQENITNESEFWDYVEDGEDI